MFDDLINLTRLNHPGIPARALEFFDTRALLATIDPKSPPRGGLQPRTLGQFTAHLPAGLTDKPPGIQEVRRVVNRLCDAGILFRVGPETGLIGDQTGYLVPPRTEHEERIAGLADFIAYGFPAVVDTYGPSIVQLVAHYNGDVQGSGTAFAIQPNALVTAAHCLSDASELSIVGIPASQLEGARIFLARDRAKDCALIRLQHDLFSGRKLPHWDEPRLLHDVVLMGYPNIPTLLGTQVTERANVATVLRGGIAGSPRDIFKTDLILVTAPARGGFSGGPIITDWGGVVGMTARKPEAEAGDLRYDPTGFALGIPSGTIREFLLALASVDPNHVEERNPKSFRWVD
jgi:hypothetical protein